MTDMKKLELALRGVFSALSPGLQQLLTPVFDQIDQKEKEKHD